VAAWPAAASRRLATAATAMSAAPRTATGRS
jgi:hypothetical protein